MVASNQRFAAAPAAMQVIDLALLAGCSVGLMRAAATSIDVWTLCNSMVEYMMLQLMSRFGLQRFYGGLHERLQLYVVL